MRRSQLQSRMMMDESRLSKAYAGRNEAIVSGDKTEEKPGVGTVPCRIGRRLSMLAGRASPLSILLCAENHHAFRSSTLFLVDAASSSAETPVISSEPILPDLTA